MYSIFVLSGELHRLRRYLTPPSGRTSPSRHLPVAAVRNEARWLQFPLAELLHAAKPKTAAVVRSCALATVPAGPSRSLGRRQSLQRRQPSPPRTPPPSRLQRRSAASWWRCSGEQLWSGTLLRVLPAPPLPSCAIPCPGPITGARSCKVPR
jgi:hypothetical protein